LLLHDQLRPSHSFREGAGYGGSVDGKNSRAKGECLAFEPCRVKRCCRTGYGEPGRAWAGVRQGENPTDTTERAGRLLRDRSSPHRRDRRSLPAALLGVGQETLNRALSIRRGSCAVQARWLL